MATTAVSPPSINLTSHSTFPIRLGTSILKPAESKKFMSVQINHKPRLSGIKDAKYSMRAHESEDDETVELSLRVGEKEYVYSGMNTSEGDRYIFFAQEKGKDIEMILEKLEACHVLNLTKTPDEKSTSKLSKRYPQLPEADERQGDTFGSSADHEFPDTGNPYDYRHYLKSGTKKAESATLQAPRSGASTPIPSQRLASTTPHSRPSKRSDGPFMAQRKRKAQESTNTNSKRVKAVTEPPTNQPSAHKNIPKLRMDRKASLHLAPFDDSGELIVENETPVQEKPRGAMALALSGQLGQRPISLHSAASSPASRVASPLPPRPEHIDEEEKQFELDEDSKAEVRRNRLGADEDDDTADADADADVEDLALPSPAQAFRQAPEKRETTVDEKGGGEDEDDLDKQLALAMAEEDEGDAPPPPIPAESDEESEEE